MNRWIVVCILTAALLAAGMSCNVNGGDPVNPTGNTMDMTRTVTNDSSAHLWGYFDVYMNLETGTVDVVPNRTVMGVEPSPFNVVDFVNGNPANLGFDIQDIVVDPAGEYITVDIDVSITHPFPGMNQYDGYDVKGIFIGDGSGELAHNGLEYAVSGVDQFMGSPPPDDSYGNPDGYTRWWNPSEFGTPGVLGYTPGAYATSGYNGNATLNPFKYFADCITSEDLLEDIFTVTPAPCQRTFSSGETNTRNYFLNFPTPSPNVKFNYAILASWEAEDIHPAYSPEASGIITTTIPDLYFVDSGNNGGSLILDISLLAPSVVGPEAIFIESEIFSAVYQLNSTEMVPLIGGNPYTSTYHTEIPADNLTKNGYTDFWVMVEYTDCDYENVHGVPNDAGTDPLISYFRHNLYIADTPYNQDPIIDSGVDGDDTPFFLATEETYSVTAHDDDLDPLTYTWTVSDTSGPVSGYDGVPGDGAGNLDVDWAAIGAVPDDVFDIDCEVIDGNGGITMAATLTVTCDNVLFYDNMESGEGDWTYDHSGPVEDWAIVSGGNDGHWWHMNNGSGASSPEYCARLFAPEITIPSGVSEAHLEIYHRAQGYFINTINTVYVGPALLQTEDSGISINKVVYPVVEGPQYDNWNFPYTDTYHFGLAWVCDPFHCWGVPSWTTVSTPTVSKVDVSSEIGNTLKFAFMYGYGLWYYGSYVWAIDDVKVTVNP